MFFHLQVVAVRTMITSVPVTRAGTAPNASIRSTDICASASLASQVNYNLVSVKFLTFSSLQKIASPGHSLF